MSLEPDDLRQTLSANQFHGVEVHAAVAAYLVHADDILVLQQSCGACLVLKSFKLSLIEQRSQWQNLQRNRSLQGYLFRLIDHSHTAATNLTDELKVADRTEPWQQVSGV